MRVVKEINLPDCRITIFQWNNRYILKLERGYLEQTYKVDQYDIANEQELERLAASPEFLEKARQRFDDMAKDFKTALAAN